MSILWSLRGSLGALGNSCNRRGVPGNLKRSQRDYMGSQVHLWGSKESYREYKEASERSRRPRGSHERFRGPLKRV